MVKILQVGAELVHADGRTDVTKVIVAFGNFSNAPYSEPPRCYPVGLLSRTQVTAWRCDERHIALFLIYHAVYRGRTIVGVDS